MSNLGKQKTLVGAILKNEKDIEELKRKSINLANNVPEAWIAPTFTNSFTNFGSPHANAGYYKDPSGRVHLRGAVKRSPTTDLGMFTLPAGYRPSAQLVSPISVFGAIGGLGITSAGVVNANSGDTSVFVSLDGISFRAA